MMRGAEGALAHKAGHRATAGRLDESDLERFVARQRRQNPRKAAREHGLARAGRADEQKIVPAGRGELERALGRELTAHVGEIGNGSCNGPRGNDFSAQPRRGAARQFGRLAQVGHGKGLDAGRARLLGIGFRHHDRRKARGLGPRRHREDAPDTGWTRPSSDNSPTTHQRFAHSPATTWPEAVSSASAMGSS